MPLPDLTSAIQPLPLFGHMSRPAAAAPAPRRDAAYLHPVFFTERFRRSSWGLDAARVTSPVAHGYVYQEAQGLAGGAIPSRL